MIYDYTNCKKKVAEAYYQQMTSVTLVPLPVHTVTSDYCLNRSCGVPKEVKAYQAKKEKGNNPMEDKVYYLKNRIDEMSCDFKDALIKQFKIGEPRTFADLVAAITGGNYTAPDATKKTYSPFDGVKWGDQVGYDAAYKSLKTAKQAAVDTIMVKDPATDGLAAMQAFEAWTYTPTAG